MRDGILHGLKAVQNGRQGSTSVSDCRFEIAGVTIDIGSVEPVLARLDALYVEFGRRLEEYGRDGRNTVLCHAGCSHCCRSGGFFAMTLAEAVRLNRAAAALPDGFRAGVRERAKAMLALQREQFARVGGPADQPGRRDEETFSARVSAVTRTHPACPLLDGDLCSVHPARPFLCRSYGYATDAYAVRSGQTLAFRSLCVLYEGVRLQDYVRANELREQLAILSRELTDGRDVGRFTLPEAILARRVMN
jgi:Fe-S-cluster containining protein